MTTNGNLRTLPEILNVERLASRLDIAADEIEILSIDIFGRKYQLMQIEQSLADDERTFSIHWKEQNGSAKDPTTGRANEKWSTKLLEQAISNDAHLDELRYTRDEHKRELARLQALLEVAQTRFNAARYQSRLASAQLAFLASSADVPW